MWGSPLDNCIFVEQESGAALGEEGFHPVPPVFPSSFLLCPAAWLLAPPPPSVQSRAQLSLHRYSVSFHLPHCISYLAAAVMKLGDQGNLENEAFIWAYGSNGFESITGEKAQHQVTDRAAGYKSWMLTLSNTSMK